MSKGEKISKSFLDDRATPSTLFNKIKKGLGIEEKSAEEKKKEEERKKLEAERIKRFKEHKYKRK